MAENVRNLRNLAIMVEECLAPRYRKLEQARQLGLLVYTKIYTPVRTVASHKTLFK